MSETELHWLSVAELSRRIHAGTLSPVELMEHLLDRVRTLDPALESFRLVPRERALATARAAETALRAGESAGPLHGIPFAAKDIFDVRGLPTTAGSKHLDNNVVETDATAVRLLREVGMVLLGKTQTVQFAMGAPGINHHHGTPHNPWAAEHHVPGGSSSGSAVAVGAGLVPMALGSDTGGSVRIPAALCGVVGLKTTVGQVSRSGVFPISWTLDSVGPLTRTVEDAALVYQALHGSDPRDLSTAAARRQDVPGALGRGVKGLRIAFAGAPFWDDAEAEVVEAVRATGEVFARLGAQVGEIELPQAAACYTANRGGLISSVEGNYMHEKLLGEGFSDYDPVVYERLNVGRGKSGVDYVRALETCRALAAEAERALADVDAFLAPATVVPSRPFAELDASIEAYRQATPLYSRNTSIGNLLGLCAVSVPCGFTAKGLPIGLMVHAKAFDEAMALRVAHAYERATEWHLRRPALAWAEAA